MNKHLTHLNKIEFVVTNACTGKCKHCSQGEHSFGGAHLDAAVATDAIKKIAAKYDIKTVMTFGGEPLLYPDVVCAILSAAKGLQIPRRQVITNGYFTKDFQAMRAVVESLATSGVNDLLLSVDAFHQETIPVDVVHHFASLAKTCGIPTRLQPAWLISPNDDNAYNQKTNQILQSFADLSFFVVSTVFVNNFFASSVVNFACCFCQEFFSEFCIVSCNSCIELFDCSVHL